MQQFVLFVFVDIDDVGGDYDDDEFEVYESMKASLSTAAVTQIPAAEGIDQDDYDKVMIIIILKSYKAYVSTNKVLKALSIFIVTER